MNNEIRKQLKEECFIRNLSPRTCSIYEYHISKFIAWNDCENIDELTIYNARDYILEKRKDGKRRDIAMVLILRSHFFISIYSISHGTTTLFHA